MVGRTVNLAGSPVLVAETEVHQAFWDLVDAGRWEPATLDLITRLADGSVYIDIGAWIGPTVLAAARTASAVVAYEPDPVAAAELRRNIALNGLSNVEIREVALLDRDGELPLSGGGAGELGRSESSLVFGVGQVSVPVADARREAAAEHFARCALLKIDVEGGEYELVSRLAPYLRAHRPHLLLSLHGVHWRRRRFEHLPDRVARLYRRLRSTVQRSVLMWHVRHYPLAYLDDRGAWVQLSWAQRAVLTLRLREDEIVLTYDDSAVS